MNAVRAGVMLLMAALVAVPAGLQSQSTQPAGTQTSSPSSTQQSAPPAKAKPKKPAEPIDPDATAGVRGSGTTHTIRVLRKGTPAEGAHVVVKNTNGSVAATCDTNAGGECQVDIGADSYIFAATKRKHAGTVSLAVDDSTGPIVVKLVKVKTESSAPNP
jgi:hypothetical protein